MCKIWIYANLVIWVPFIVTGERSDIEIKWDESFSSDNLFPLRGIHLEQISHFQMAKKAILVGSPSCVTLTKTWRHHWIIYITNPTQDEHKKKKSKKGGGINLWDGNRLFLFSSLYVFMARFLTWLCVLSQVRHPGSIGFLLLFPPGRCWSWWRSWLGRIIPGDEAEHSNPECPGGFALFVFQIRNTKLGTSLTKNPNNLHSFKRDQVCLLCPSLIYCSLNSF